MMAFDAYKILDEREAGSMIDLIAPCMDEYLCIIEDTQSHEREASYYSKDDCTAT